MCVYVRVGEHAEGGTSSAWNVTQVALDVTCGIYGLRFGALDAGAFINYGLALAAVVLLGVDSE